MQMILRGTPNPLRGRFTAVVLDYGADAEPCGEGAVEISDQGMLVRTRWQFAVGTVLEVVLACDSEGEEPGARFTVRGMVVWCERMLKEQEARFESTVHFMDLPDELRACLRERALTELGES